ncbi:mucin-2 [Phlebotomus papatasi]|uniref:mucin-2 n=1 Tax=Phlebotomus papatasi TaxID=29031 RepID=UPI002483A39C|nr:mucin-2 [Phlebotomus papatasi]
MEKNVKYLRQWDFPSFPFDFLSFTSLSRTLSEMTRIWVILWAVFVVFSVVVADGNVAQVPGNHSVGQEKHTGHGEKFLYTEGGSFSSKETQKSVKKELVEPPPPITNATLTSGNETKGIPGNTTNGNSPESKNTTLPDVKTPAKNTTIPLAKETLPETNKNASKVNITGKDEGILHGNATTATPPKVINVTTPSTTTTTTPRPKKPTLTVSVVDDPNLLEAASKSAPKHPQSPESGRLDVEEPVAQLSQENILELPVNHRDYIVPIVVLIFAIPMILGLATVVIRRFKDYWLTRHYRRMDYLLDGMYNE